MTQSRFDASSEKGAIKPIYIVGAAAAAAVIAVLILFGYMGHLKTQMVNKETALSAQYQSNQNELSSYVSGFYEQTGIAKVKTDKLDKILIAAVKGRYEGKSSAAPANGQLISALTEAYPDLKQLDIYDKVLDYIQSGRESYKNKQDLLLDKLREYDAFRNQGLIRPMLLRMVGAPSDNLVARFKDDGEPTVLRGQAAEDKMYEIVTTKRSDDAYDSGEMDPLKVDE